MNAGEHVLFLSGDWQAPKTIGGFNVQQLCLNWKARLQLITGNVKAAKRSIRSLLALDVTNPQVSHLPSQVVPHVSYVELCLYTEAAISYALVDELCEQGPDSMLDPK